jgi:hypothetical protein
MSTNRFIQLPCLNTPTPKNARVSHLLTVTGYEDANLVVAYATTFGFATAFSWLSFNDATLAFFREQEIGFVHFHDALK